MFFVWVPPCFSPPPRGCSARGRCNPGPSKERRGPLARRPEPPRHCTRSPPGGSREPLPALQLTSPCLPGSGSFLDLRSQDVNWANDFPFVLAKGPSCGRPDKHDVLLDNEILLQGVFICKHLESGRWESDGVGLCYGLRLDSGSLWLWSPNEGGTN